MVAADCMPHLCPSVEGDDIEVLVENRLVDAEVLLDLLLDLVRNLDARDNTAAAADEVVHTHEVHLDIVDFGTCPCRMLLP